MSPLPAGITDLQGAGTIWQDYSVYLRFTASDATIKAILAQGYTPVVWSYAKPEFELPKRFSRSFGPDWAPAPADCYKKSTGSASQFLLVDRGNGQVHFHGYSM